MGLRPYKVSHETFILLTILLIMQGIHIHFVFLANVLRETVNDLLRINNLYVMYFNFHCILSVYCYMLRFRFFNS